MCIIIRLFGLLSLIVEHNGVLIPFNASETVYGARCSLMDQVKFVEDSL